MNDKFWSLNNTFLFLVIYFYVIFLGITIIFDEINIQKNQDRINQIEQQIKNKDEKKFIKPEEPLIGNISKKDMESKLQELNKLVNATEERKVKLRMQIADITKDVPDSLLHDIPLESFYSVNLSCEEIILIHDPFVLTDVYSSIETIHYSAEELNCLTDEQISIIERNIPKIKSEIFNRINEDVQ